MTTKLSCGHSSVIRPSGFPIRYKCTMTDEEGPFRAVEKHYLCYSCYVNAIVGSDVLLEDWEEQDWIVNG